LGVSHDRRQGRLAHAGSASQQEQFARHAGAYLVVQRAQAGHHAPQGGFLGVQVVHHHGAGRLGVHQVDAVRQAAQAQQVALRVL
jgi:hypothetical protein